MEFKRCYAPFTQSTFLLGPRGVGKSTFIRETCAPRLTIDLLRSSDYLRLSRNPSELEDLVGPLKKGDRVFIDEIQRVPELLNEVHRLIELKGLVFFLTGSSARRLRAKGVNLLAGRALMRKMFPLTIAEIGGKRNLPDLLLRGTLPMAINCKSNEMAEDFLASYVSTYLKEEIHQEALVRQLDSFSRFVEIAGQYQGQVLNFESLAREVGKSGDTIQAWFQILRDTLVGEFVEAYPLGVFPRETTHPKFYFFDSGVARVAAGIRDFSDSPETRGYFFECLILNELRAYLEVYKKTFKIGYVMNPSLGDIDFVIELRKKSMSAPAHIALVEVKLTKKWDSRFEKMSFAVSERTKNKVVRNLAVYLGDRRMKRGSLEIFPLDAFISELWRGNLI